MKDLPIPIYISDDGSVKTDIQIKDDTIRLNQKQMGQIFGVNRQAISKHINNIHNQGEIDKYQVSSILEHTAEDGKTYNTEFYNLDMIISVGYRVNSTKATQFRIRATNILKQYIYNGYAINEYRLQQIGIDDLKKSLEIVSRAITNGNLNNDEAVGLAKLMTIYIPSLKRNNDKISNQLKLINNIKLRRYNKSSFFYL